MQLIFSLPYFLFNIGALSWIIVLIFMIMIFVKLFIFFIILLRMVSILIVSMSPSAIIIWFRLRSMVSYWIMGRLRWMRWVVDLNFFELFTPVEWWHFRSAIESQVHYKALFATFFFLYSFITISWELFF